MSLVIRSILLTILVSFGLNSFASVLTECNTKIANEKERAGRNGEWGGGRTTK